MTLKTSYLQSHPNDFHDVPIPISLLQQRNRLLAMMVVEVVEGVRGIWTWLHRMGCWL